MAEMRPEDVPDELAEAACREMQRAEREFPVQTIELAREVLAVVLPLYERQLQAQRDWQPGRWHQVRQPDGSLWMETSDGDEAEAEARKQGWPLYRLWECRETEWRPEGGDRG